MTNPTERPEERSATWRVPKLLLYRVAVPGWHVVANRYSTGLIGYGIVLGPWCLSLTWKRP